MHLRPGALRAHAATAAGLVDELDGLDAPDAALPGAGELGAALVRARRELHAVRDALLAASSAAEDADAAVADALRSIAPEGGGSAPATAAPATAAPAAGPAGVSWADVLGGDRP
jgi:hypothetical protein